VQHLNKTSQMLDRGSFAYNFSVEVTAKIYSMQRLC